MEQFLGIAATLLLIAYFALNTVVTWACWSGKHLMKPTEGEGTTLTEDIIFYLEVFLFGALHGAEILSCLAAGYVCATDRGQRNLRIATVVLVAMGMSVVAAYSARFWFEVSFSPAFVLALVVGGALWAVLHISSWILGMEQTATRTAIES